MPHLHVCFGLLLLFASSMFAQQFSILYFNNVDCSAGTAANYVGLFTKTVSDCTGTGSGTCATFGTQSQFYVCNASTYAPPALSGNLTLGCDTDGPYLYYYFQDGACVSGLPPTNISQKGAARSDGTAVDALGFSDADCTTPSSDPTTNFAYQVTQTCTTTRTLANGTVLTGQIGYQLSIPVPPTDFPTDIVTDSPTTSIFDTNELIAVAASLPSLFDSNGEYTVNNITILQNVSATDNGLINFDVTLQDPTTLDQACNTLIDKMVINVPVLGFSPCNANCMTCSIVSDLPNTVQIQINSNFNSVASHVASLAVLCIALCLIFV